VKTDTGTSWISRPVTKVDGHHRAEVPRACGNARFAVPARRRFRLGREGAHDRAFRAIVVVALGTKAFQRACHFLRIDDLAAQLGNLIERDPLHLPAGA
jgi:hypothetical protein